MNHINRTLLAFIFSAFCLNTTVFAQFSNPFGSQKTVEQQRQDILKTSDSTLKALYKVQPKAKELIEKSVGYATFSNFGMKILIAGGGTGTGAAPLVAQVARESGALVVAMATKPFAFEGERRSRVADAGIAEIKDNVDTLITIPNDRLLQTIDRKTSLLDAFGVVDDVLRQGVQGISDLITIHGLINLDFADVKAIMSNAGSALMGIGRASGENRAIEAARQAIDSPLLELNIEGAKGVLFNITGGRNMSMHEIDEAAKTITSAVDEDANIIFGAVLDESLDDDIKITVVATGFEGNEARETFTFQAPTPEPADEYVDAVYGAPTYTERKPFIDEAPRRFEPTPEEDVPTIESDGTDELLAVEEEAPRRKPETGRSFVQKSNRGSLPDDDDDDLDIPTFMRHKID